MPETIWATVWQVVISVGLGGFFLLVLIVIPLGARDIGRLFRQLDQPPPSPGESKQEEL